MAIKKQTKLDETFHALADGTRRRMLSMLVQRGECTATELGAPFASAQPTISKHIKVLERAGLVTRRIDGRIHHFRIDERRLAEAEAWLTRHRELWHNALNELRNVIEDLKNVDES